MKPHVLIVGGGFAGLNAANKLGLMDFPVTIIDKQNFHLFQPLLYQVATGFLTPGDIASPLRSALSKRKSVKVIQDEITSIVPQTKEVCGNYGKYSYDILILAAGVSNAYFGNEHWEKHTIGLKTLDDSLKLRTKILSSFEAAERTDDPIVREKLLTISIIGGGPTGIELAGALSELSRATLKNEFRNIDPSACKIILFEGGQRVLSAFHPNISAYVERTIKKLGIEIHTGTLVKNIGEGFLEYEQAGVKSRIDCATIIWAAGVRAVPLSEIIQKSFKAEADKAGRIKVLKDLSIPGHPEIFVLGDLAHAEGKDGKPLPGLAPVAMQQGKYLAKLIIGRSQGKDILPFTYYDKGNMAVIGKGRAVAETALIRMTGFPAWVGWAFIHIYFLIEFENKLVVFLRWAWNYFTNKRGSRLITKV
jgi:NADH dehydrogenase